MDEDVEPLSEPEALPEAARLPEALMLEVCALSVPLFLASVSVDDVLPLVEPLVAPLAVFDEEELLGDELA